MPEPLTLTPFEQDNLALLYLARFAKHMGPRDALDPTYGIVPWYHQEIRECIGLLGLKYFASDNLEDLFERRGGYNYVLSLFNRAPFRHSEVFVSSVCEYLGVLYLGATPHTRALAEDKHLAKVMATHLGIPTPAWTILRVASATLTPPTFPGPYIAKPRCGAGSQWIDENSVQDTWDAIEPRVQQMLEEGTDVIVEQFIPGTNITVPVLGHREPWVLPCIENRSKAKGNVTTQRQKRLLDGGLYRQVVVDNVIIARLDSFVKCLYATVYPIDYLRADFRVDTCSGQIHFLEFNVCCNLGSHSTVVMAANNIGVNQTQLLGHILAFSVRRQGMAWQEH